MTKKKYRYDSYYNRKRHPECMWCKYAEPSYMSGGPYACRDKWHVPHNLVGETKRRCPEFEERGG